MKYSDYFPSKFINADTLEGRDRTLTMKQIERFEFDDGPKPKVEFEETESELILNRTNFKTIADLYGGDTDTWAGKRITLFPTEVDFRGTQTMAVRVRMSPPVSSRITDEDVPF